MNDATADRLIAVNREFYTRFASPFDRSRAGFQPGYERLLDRLPPGTLEVLDAGCGNGRLGLFLASSGRLAGYTGVDFIAGFLERAADVLAAAGVPAQFLIDDLAAPEQLAGLGPFDLVACLSAVQHIPQEARRIHLLDLLAGSLRPGGRLALASWQFLGSRRQRAKVLPWSTIGLADDQVGPEDFLLSWRRGGEGFRYVCLIDEAATARLAARVGLRIVDQFRSDGREGNLNLYTIFDRPGGSAGQTGSGRG